MERFFGGRFLEERTFGRKFLYERLFLRKFLDEIFSTMGHFIVQNVTAYNWLSPNNPNPKPSCPKISVLKSARPKIRPKSPFIKSYLLQNVKKFFNYLFFHHSSPNNIHKNSGCIDDNSLIHSPLKNMNSMHPRLLIF